MFFKKRPQQTNQVSDFSPSSFYSKLKTGGDKELFIGVITSVDTEWDIATVYTFNHMTEIKVPLNTELGLSKDDVVYIAKVEGSYYILDKAYVGYLRDETYKYNPHTLDEKEILKKINVPENIKADFIKDIYVEKEEGEAVVNKKITGYKLSDKFIMLFSGLTKISATLSEIFMSSTEIIQTLFRSKTTKKMVESDDGYNSYSIEIYRKKDGNNTVPYMIELKGDIQYALETEKINISDTLNIQNAVYMRIIFKQDFNLPDAKNPSIHTYINRNNKFSDGNINKDFLDNVPFWDQRLVDDSEWPKITIRDKDYFIVSIYYETINGEQNSFAVKNNTLFTEANNVAKEKYLIATDSYRMMWQNSFYEYNYPYNNNAFKIINTYSNSIVNNYNDINVNYHRMLSTKKIFEIEEFEIDKESDLQTIKKTIAPKHIEYKTIHNVKYINNELLQQSPIYNIEMTSEGNSTNIFFSTKDTYFSIVNSSDAIDKGMVLNSNSMYMFGFKNLICPNLENAFLKEANLLTNYLITNNLHIEKNFNVSGTGNIYLSGENIYLKSNKNFIAYMESGALVAEKSVAMTAEGGAVAVNKEATIVSGENTYVSNYCRCQ